MLNHKNNREKVWKILEITLLLRCTIEVVHCYRVYNQYKYNHDTSKKHQF